MSLSKRKGVNIYHQKKEHQKKWCVWWNTVSWVSLLQEEGTLCECRKRKKEMKNEKKCSESTAFVYHLQVSMSNRQQNRSVSKLVRNLSLAFSLAMWQIANSLIAALRATLLTNERVANWLQIHQRTHRITHCQWWWNCTEKATNWKVGQRTVV